MASDSKTGEVQVVEDVPALTAPAVAWLENAISEALRARGRCTVALSGGNTPRPILEALADRPLEWDWIDFYFVDERCVPPDHPDSNFRMANLALFQPAQIASGRLHRMRGEEVPEKAAEAYARALPERLDVALYGVGPDGHCCSLFPGSPLVLEAERTVAAVHGSPKPPPDRITVLPKVIAQVRSGLVLVSGADKAEAVARALRPGPVQEVPARLLRGCHWIVDRAAGSKLA